MFLAFWPSTKWWARKFSHVSVLKFENETWTLVDVDRHAVTIRSLYKRSDVDQMWSELSGTVIVHVPEGDGRAFFSPLSCVSFAKHAAGIRSRALLPDGLFRDLCRNNAEIVHDGRRQASGIAAAAQPAPQG